MARPLGVAEASSDDVRSALRDGPFHIALDRAVRARRLSLETLQRRLAEGGVHVGLSTLSYWRRGHRHPEGKRSARALQLLEGILDLPANSLLILASTSTDMKRAVEAIGLDAALGLTPERIAALHGIDPDVNLQVSLLSAHFDVWIDADRAERSLRARCLVSCKVDGADRFVCLYEGRAGSDSRGVLARTGSCRVGRIRTEPSRGLLAAELRFDRPLRVGENYVFDYEIDCVGEPMRTACFEYGLRLPCPQLVLRVQFDPAAVPVACYRYHRPNQEPAESVTDELPVGASLAAHSIVLNGQVGVHGIRWEWD